MAAPNKKSKSERLICLCNGVSQETIEKAIESGCRTLSRIFDATMAGVGACGGSCQPTLKKMLESYLQTGRFPENPCPPTNRRKSSK
jgi:bacterioferritin-associated ferredoxin